MVCVQNVIRCANISGTVKPVNVMIAAKYVVISMIPARVENAPYVAGHVATTAGGIMKLEVHIFVNPVGWRVLIPIISRKLQENVPYAEENASIRMEQEVFQKTMVE